MRGKSGGDVIFKGSEHLAPMSRASVTMVIDNKDKIDTSHISQELAPYLVYDTLTLSRVIYADGTSDYLLNDAKIRLKDVQELLSFAGIGGSAHTIINQGEADRILLASPRDRKEALEDALGLRVFHIRLNESKRKLERVKTNVHEVELLRLEIKPHLALLERQVKKIESQEEERQVLQRLLIAYLNREEHELSLLDERIREQGTSATLILITDSIRKELSLLREKKVDIKVNTEESKQILQTELRLIIEQKDQITKTLGRLEAEKSYLEREKNKEKERTAITLGYDEFTDIHAKTSYGFEGLLGGLAVSDVSRAKRHAEEISTLLETFFTTHSNNDALMKENIEAELKAMVAMIQDHESKEKELQHAITKKQEQLHALTEDSKREVQSHYEEEKKKMTLESKLRELESVIALRRQEESEFALRKGHFDALVQEGVIIVGRVVLAYKEHVAEEKYKAIEKHDLMRAIERSKLRIEEAGVPNREEVVAEYKSTKERDEYLIKELQDIQESERRLLVIIKDLETSLEEKFSNGVTEVSKVFSDFFSEVFVGGKGKLSLIQIAKMDDEGNQTTEQGIELDVSLPNKKVKEISMFSGGERALVSIALLFAMSAITPPPFMVLDETDAPLDESNARKYGVMLKRLAEKSKLLVITHNRETMNHCDMLYGVTIGIDGGSKLLSITFKQPEEMAQEVTS
jgi:chromosome segregation protein